VFPHHGNTISSCLPKRIFEEKKVIVRQIILQTVYERFGTADMFASDNSSLLRVNSFIIIEDAHVAAALGSKSTFQTIK